MSRLEAVGGPRDGEWLDVPFGSRRWLAAGVYAAVPWRGGGFVFEWCPLATPLPDERPYNSEPMTFNDGDGWE